MTENAKLDRLLTQVNCRITSIARLRDAGAISERKAEQELKQGVELRAKFMRQIDRQNLPLTPKAWRFRPQPSAKLANDSSRQTPF